MKVQRVSDIYAERCKIRRDDDWFALKLQEETGELVAEHLRLSGRGRVDGRTPQEMRMALEDEAADLLAMLLLYCRQNDIDLEVALERKWFRHLKQETTV
ncbi:MAG TPA: phosphoribosyl-ATP pyrophosphohydrolase [Devosiaceae bacterium]|nr:phosphoribosyl-ATP pyrophosphohydrolase [Devosiaceae bacterium]